MCIHGDKSQPERDWVLNGRLNLHSLGLVTFRCLQNDCHTDCCNHKSQINNYCKVANIECKSSGIMQMLPFLVLDLECVH